MIIAYSIENGIANNKYQTYIAIVLLYCYCCIQLL